MLSVEILRNANFFFWKKTRIFWTKNCLILVNFMVILSRLTNPPTWSVARFLNSLKRTKFVENFHESVRKGKSWKTNEYRRRVFFITGWNFWGCSNIGSCLMNCHNYFYDRVGHKKFEFLSIRVYICTSGEYVNRLYEMRNSYILKIVEKQKYYYLR